MSGQKFLPSEVEEDLAQAAGVLIRSGILRKIKLEDILEKIAKEMNLSLVHRSILRDPDWLSKFKRRWFHKLFPGERRFTDSFPDFTQRQIQSNKKDERPRNGILSPKYAKLKIARVMPTVVLDKYGMSSNFLPQNRQHKEQSLYSGSSFVATNGIFSSCKETSNPKPQDFLAEDIKKKAQMGLRLHVKPIERFNSEADAKSRKETAKGIGNSSTQDDHLVLTNPSWSRRDTTLQGDNAKQKNGFAFNRHNGKKRRARTSGELLDSGEESSGGSSSSSLGSPCRKNKSSSPRFTSAANASLSEDGEAEYDRRPMSVKKKKRNLKPGEGVLTEMEVPNSSQPTTAQENPKVSFKDRKANMKLVRLKQLKLEDLCLACGTTENVTAKHPLFLGGLCQEHKLLMHESFFQYDDDGYHSVCSVCCMGNKVVLCDKQDCVRCYCKACLNTLTHSNCFKVTVKSDRWVCNFCAETRDPQDLLIRRPEWKEEIQRLYQNTGESRYPTFPVPSPIPVQSRRPIRVLSLFDGIATGIVALKQLGLEIKTFVASEIDEDAIRLVQNKHSEVVHIGDVTKITDEQISKMGPFDLLLGGSPCNDLSGANPRRRGLLDAEGSGCLFFDFYRILRTIEPPRCRDGGYKRPFFWLFENVVSMKGIEKERISRFLQCEPKMADARYVSAAARPRLFWGNLPGLRERKIVPGVKDHLTVQECLEPNRKAQVEKLNTITTKYTCLYQGVTRRAPVMHNGKEDVLWTTELERVFGVPEHYTDVNNLGPRERLALLGRSWSVPIVRLLLAPLKEYFSGVQQFQERSSSGKWWS